MRKGVLQAKRIHKVKKCSAVGRRRLSPSMQHQKPRSDVHPGCGRVWGWCSAANRQVKNSNRCESGLGGVGFICYLARTDTFLSDERRQRQMRGHSSYRVKILWVKDKNSRFTPLEAAVGFLFPLRSPHNKHSEFHKVWRLFFFFSFLIEPRLMRYTSLPVLLWFCFDNFDNEICKTFFWTQRLSY